MIDAVLGELSAFHKQHGFYVHGIPIEAAKLPKGWSSRAVPIRNANTRYHTGFCLEAHDLAASKLAAFREKDREFVRALLANDMVSGKKLISRLRALPIPRAEVNRLTNWVDATVRDLHS